MRKHYIRHLMVCAFTSLGLWVAPMQLQATETKMLVTMQIMPPPLTTEATIQQAQKADYIYQSSGDEQEIVYF